MKTKLLTAAFILGMNTHASFANTSDDLLNAIENQNVSQINSLVRYGIDPNQKVSIYNGTPLMHAVDTSTKVVVEKLITLGSKVDVVDNFGSTPLISSLKQNKADIASLLISKSRNINLTDDKGASALHYAARTGNEKLFVEVLQQGGNLQALDSAGNNALFYAIAGRNKTIVSNLVKMNYFDLTHKNVSGENAYMIAQRYGLADIAKRFPRGRNTIMGQ